MRHAHQYYSIFAWTCTQMDNTLNTFVPAGEGHRKLVAKHADATKHGIALGYEARRLQ